MIVNTVVVLVVLALVGTVEQIQLVLTIVLRILSPRLVYEEDQQKQQMQKCINNSIISIWKGHVYKHLTMYIHR